MTRRLLIDTAEFVRTASRLNDIELGALMRALMYSAIDGGTPKNILESSYFGKRTNGFFKISPTDVISSDNCSFAHMENVEE